MRLLVVVLALGCGTAPASAPPSSRSTSPSTHQQPVTEAQPTAPDADLLPEDCATACTEIAVCHEEVYETEYSQGGYCTLTCEERGADEKQVFFRCVAESRDACARMVAC